MLFNFYSTSKNFNHTTACLIQGLNQLGHELHANFRPKVQPVMVFVPRFQ